MFDIDFFNEHQSKLLWLLNKPIVSKWFRYVLRINSDRSDIKTRQIDKIEPNAIFWSDGDLTVGEFRTHDKFSKRLYHAFKYIWWLMHFWDWLVADRFIPQLSFGFATLTTYPDAGNPGTTTHDVDLWRYVAAGDTWNSFATGNGNGGDQTSTSQSAVYIKSHTTTNLFTENDRAQLLFDTSSITSNGQTFSAVLSIWRSSTFDGGNWAPNMALYSSNPSSNTAFTNSDYENMGSTLLSDDIKELSTLEPVARHYYILNSNGITAVNISGITKLALRNQNYDVANVQPTWISNKFCYININYADATGSVFDPYLLVKYYTAANLSTVGAMPAFLLP